jgi:D-sedoheptulose 7-phosphate isomerase
MSHVRTYVLQLHETLEALPVEQIEQVIRILEEARLERRQVFILGNGGSASTASHFVCDLAKNTRRKDCPRFCAIGLTDNMAIFSAYANDEGYESVFAEQLASLVHPGDIVIAISASGNSPNVLRAVDLANEMGATTVGLTGFDGGRLGSLVAVHVNVPSNIIEHVEDVHLSLEHMICKALREEIQPMGAQAALEILPAARGIAVQAPLSPEVILQNPGPARAKSTSELLSALSRAIEQGGEADVVLQRILGLTLVAMQAASGSLIVLNQSREVVAAALAYAGTVRPAQGLEETVQRGLAGWVVENRQPVLIANTLEDPRWLRRPWEETAVSTRSAASAPLIAGGQVVGVLTVVQSQGRQLTQDDLVLLMAMAACISYVGAEILRAPRGLRSLPAQPVNSELRGA